MHAAFSGWRPQVFSNLSADTWHWKPLFPAGGHCNAIRAVILDWEDLDWQDLDWQDQDWQDLDWQI